MSTLFVTGAVSSQSRVWQVHKHGFQGAEDVDLTVGDQSVNLFSWLRGFVWAYFSSKGKRWSLKDQSFCDFFPIAKEAKQLQQIVGFCQPCFSLVLYPVSWACDKAGNVAFKVLMPLISLLVIILYIRPHD